MNSLDPAYIIANLKAQSRKEALIELAGLFQDLNQEVLVSALLERESLGTTAIVSGMALPHAKIEGLDDILIAVGRSKAGIQWGARDGQPVHLIFVMIAPQKAAASYLQTLSSLSLVLKNNADCALLKHAPDKEEISRILQGCLQST
jgi:PTS system nitrogen regulatory IIA component